MNANSRNEAKFIIGGSSEGKITEGTASHRQDCISGAIRLLEELCLLTHRAGATQLTFADPGDCPTHPRDPEFGTTLSREDVAAVIGVGVDEIASEWPVQVISTGGPFAIVPFRTLQSLANLKYTFAQGAELLERAGTRFFYFLCPERRQGLLEARARMIFYGGEDPATGSAAGCAASWMVRYGIAKSDEQVLIRQGVEIRRPSEIYVRATQQGERVTDVRVGGYAVEVLRGSVTL